MGIKYKKYDEDCRKDYCFYESSNLWASVCDDIEDGFKTLTVVFNDKTGIKRVYRYYDIDVNDYILFKNDISNGKALNKFIIKKGYKSEKLEDYDFSEVNKMYESLSGEILSDTPEKEEEIITEDVDSINKSFYEFLEEGNTVTELTSNIKPELISLINNEVIKPIKVNNDSKLIELKEYLYNIEINLDKCKLLLKSLV